MQLLHQGFTYHQHLGRFRSVRRTYSFLQGQYQELSPKRLNHIVNRESLFAPLNIPDCIAEIRRSGVFPGLQLPPEIIAAVHQHAVQNPCQEPGFSDTFMIQQLQNGRLANGRSVLRGLVSRLAECDAITQIIRDPQLMQVVQGYLGYVPAKITRHLTWSCPSDLSVDAQKQLYPPANYHYDVAGLNFMAINFYITDVDINAGPHVMMLYSHDRKRLSMIFNSARQSDQAIWDYYGELNELTLLGQAGFGFIQDSSCYHKVVPPKSQNRLFLQVRYA
jgi:hypothetical protein